MKKLIISLLLLVIVSSCKTQNSSTSNNNQYTDTLNVALYPYVPRFNQFQSELEIQWSKKHPNCKLNFVSWDCYSSDPDENLDVFVFDNIFMSYFIEHGFLMEWKKKDIDNFDDFIPYAIWGCKDKQEGELYYGLPQIGCTNMFYYRKEDKVLGSAQTYTEIYTILGDAPDISVIPPINKGLLVDLSGSTTDACLYIDFSMDNGVPYSWNPPMPSSDSLSESMINQIRKLVLAGGSKQVSYEDSISYGRAIWFSEQRGRAMVNFTEAMSVMNPKVLNDIAFKIMPFSDKKGINLFYTDVIGVNSRLRSNPVKKQLAFDLANLLGSSDYITACFGPDAEGNSPQYLMPVRQSVFDKLSENWPMYKEMSIIVHASDPKPFRLGPNSRDWFKNNKHIIKQRILEEVKKIRDLKQRAIGT